MATGLGAAVAWLTANAAGIAAVTAVGALGVSAYSATQAGDMPDSDTPDITIDKSTPETEAELDAVKIGADSEESTSAGAKARFKVDREPSSAGVTAPEGVTPGVQL